MESFQVFFFCHLSFLLKIMPMTFICVGVCIYFIHFFVVFHYKNKARFIHFLIGGCLGRFQLSLYPE